MKSGTEIGHPGWVPIDSGALEWTRTTTPLGTGPQPAAYTIPPRGQVISFRMKFYTKPGTLSIPRIPSRKMLLRLVHFHQLQDHRVAGQWLAAPVLADPGKETMLDLVPFACSRRHVADGDRQAGFIRQLLQLPFP